MARYFSVTSPR